MRPNSKRPWAIGQSERALPSPSRVRRPPWSSERSPSGRLLTGGLGPGSAPTAAATAAASPNPAGVAPTWNTYFYPLKVGWTCQEDLSTGATGSLTVTAVTKTKQGQAVTIDAGGSTDVRGTTVPTDATTHYVVTKGGQLISGGSSAGQTGGLAFRVVGTTVYPAVQTLLSAGSGLSHVHASAPLGRHRPGPVEVDPQLPRHVAVDELWSSKSRAPRWRGSMDPGEDVSQRAGRPLQRCIRSTSPTCWAECPRRYRPGDRTPRGQVAGRHRLVRARLRTGQVRRG